MSVARFCVCGFLFPAGSGAAQTCPACGRSTVPAFVPSPKVQVIPLLPIDYQPAKSHAYKAVEIAAVNYADDEAIPFDGSPTGRSVDASERRRRKFEVAVDIDIERRRRREMWGTRGSSSNSWNRWPAAGSFEDCITYPLRSIVWVLVMAWAWSTLLFFGVRVAFSGLDYWIADIIVLAAGVVVLGFTHRLCQHAYASSCADQTTMLSWPKFDFVTDAKKGLLGCAGLLMGPIPVALLAGWFWINGGRTFFIDRLILIELVTVALTWWLLVVVSAQEFGSIHPRSIVRWCESRGWVPLVVIFAAMSVVTLGLWFLAGIFSVGRDAGIVPQLILLPAALFGIFTILFALLRWLGVRIRRQTPRPQPVNMKWMAEQG